MVSRQTFRCDEEKQTWLVALALAVPTILAGLPLAEDV